MGITSAEATLLFILICGVSVSYNACVECICEQPRDILTCERPLRVIGTAFLILTSIVPRPFHAYHMLHYAAICCCFVTELPSIVGLELVFRIHWAILYKNTRWCALQWPSFGIIAEVDKRLKASIALEGSLHAHGVLTSVEEGTHYCVNKSQWLFFPTSGYGVSFNTLRPRKNDRHFSDDVFKCIFLNENVWISLKISLKFVPKGQIDNNPALVQIMAWRRSGDKPLSEPMMVSLLTHICVTRPQWVKDIYQWLFNANNLTSTWLIPVSIFTQSDFFSDTDI